MTDEEIGFDEFKKMSENEVKEIIDFLWQQAEEGEEVVRYDVLTQECYEELELWIDSKQLRNDFVIDELTKKNKETDYDTKTKELVLIRLTSFRFL